MDFTIGTVTTVPYTNTAGLRKESNVAFMFRAQHESLWETLERSSCLVEGPPGSGKSTAVWLWLINRVIRTGSPAVWVHYTKVGSHFEVIVRLTDGELVFEKIVAKEPFNAPESTYNEIQICVADGVTIENKDRAGASWHVFGLDPSVYGERHMIWVSSQQLVIPREHLEVFNMEWYSFFSWSAAEIHAFAVQFSPVEQERFKNDVISSVPETRMLPDATIIDFEQAITIKMFYCGCSARWMFGMGMKSALQDIELHLSKVEDAKMIQSGLSGSRNKTAVNHIISMYESTNPEELASFQIASSFMIEKLSESIGLEAIRSMYASKWVRNNPSVHGFVFEWDILTRLNKLGTLMITDRHGSSHTWTVTKTMRLSEFLMWGVTADETLVCPEKWNHPEYDGLFIRRDEELNMHLVAWNASEASTHAGKVSKLVVMLEVLSQREVNPINFASVRFMYLVPTEELDRFKMPSGSDVLLAVSQLTAWSFQGFEVWATNRSV